jgi:hypothetical protein
MISRLTLVNGAEVTYRCAYLSWHEGPFVDVRSQTDEHIARFPLNFLVKGRVCTWDYIRAVCVDIIDTESGHFCTGLGGRSLDLPIEPTEGTYYFFVEGEISLSVSDL